MDRARLWDCFGLLRGSMSEMVFDWNLESRLCRTSTLHCNDVQQRYAMKPKLTLRVEGSLKEKAKEIAERRGTSVSALVSNYFEILVAEEKGQLDPSGQEDDYELSAEGKRVKDRLGSPPPDAPFEDPRGELTEDERAFVKAAHEKHR